MARHRLVRGRHRAPTCTGRVAARVAVAGVVGALPIGLTPAAQAGPPGGWGPIVECESGNRNINNSTYPRSSASGYWQIIDGTWAANGGLEFAPRAIDATRAQQEIVADRIYERRGSLADWNASRSCWAGKSGPAPAAPEPAPARRQAVSEGRAADGTGQYVCDRARLHFDACDPDTLGQVVDFPPYRQSAPQPSPQLGVAPRTGRGDTHVVARGEFLARIAVEHGTTWRALYDVNRGVIGGNPALIHPGQTLRIP